MKSQFLILYALLVSIDLIPAQPVEDESNPTNSTSFLVNLSQENKLRRAIIESNALKYLSENPGIEHLRVKYPTMYFLNEINAILPNLTKLSLISLSPGFSSSDGDIEMNNIEELIIESIDSIPSHLYFDNLKSLKLQIDGFFGMKWSQFFANNVNSNLTNLYLYTEEMTYSSFLHIGRQFPNLTSVEIICDSLMNRGIAQFVEESDHLERFELDGYISGFYINLLKNHFKYSEWNFEVDCRLYLNEEVGWRSDTNPCLCKVTLTRLHENLVTRTLKGVRDVMHNYNEKLFYAYEIQQR